MRGDFPGRIVCLTEETTETLYLLGEDARIVALRPDLVLGFSDLQADIAAALARKGLEVHLFNHRSVQEILGMVRMLGGMIGCEAKAAALARRLADGVERVRVAAAALPRRPRVYFEEWDEPPISAIRWVGELIAIAGGDNCFPELAQQPLGRDRIIADPMEVVRRQPELIIGSWCGKKFRPAQVAARPGWADIPAVRDGELHEIKSALILQPGPAALTDGLAAMHALIRRWAAAHADFRTTDGAVLRGT